MDARTDSRPVVAMTAISKSFAGTRALDDVDLAIAPGTVHALVGENGAGKSTLIKIGTGALAPDAGTVTVDGDDLTGAGRRAFQAAGVRVIYQERQIAPDLTVAENVLLDRLPGRAGSVSWRRMRAEAAERLAGIGLDVDPGADVRSLSVAEWQQIELARAVDYDARLVIMDEPTASLSRTEVEHLFTVVDRLRDRGVAVLYISHHLDEVFRIADEVTVLRDGRRAHHGPVAGLTPADLVERMFGPLAHELERRRDVEPTHVVIECDHVDLDGRLRDVDCRIGAGEIVGFTGGLGSGVSDLAGVLVGAVRPTSGQVRIDGRRVTSRTRAARSVAYVPADRKRRGLLLDRSIADNLTLAELAVPGSPLDSSAARRRRAGDLMRRAGVKTDSVRRGVGTLSGGNQQKVVIGRWLDHDCPAYVFDEPTAGIDIPSKQEIYRTMRRLADGGAAVVVCSTDFQEIGMVADRILVLRDGRVVGETTGADATEQHLIELEMSA